MINDDVVDVGAVIIVNFRIVYDKLILKNNNNIVAPPIYIFRVKSQEKRSSNVSIIIKITIVHVDFAYYYCCYCYYYCYCVSNIIITTLNTLPVDTL